MKRTVALCALWLTLASAARAGQVTATCPIDGERFVFDTPPELSSHQTYLDQRPVDPAFPWPHPKCPASGFVIYKSAFSESEISRLRQYVPTDDYRTLSAANTTHYLEAALRRHLGDPPYEVAWALVQASWEAASDPDRYRRYAGEALAAYDSIPLNSLPERRYRVLKQMLSGELARRLGQFDAARERFLRMRDSADLSHPFYQRIIDLQLELIRKKDAGPHRIPY